jgi:GTP cyclohydrolase I
MNAPERIVFLPDVQSETDSRGLSIDSVATFSMTVGLSADTKGTHMSRFVELLEAQTEALDPRDSRRC